MIITHSELQCTVKQWNPYHKVFSRLITNAPFIHLKHQNGVWKLSAVSVNCLAYVTQLAWTPRFQEVASYYDRLTSLYFVPSVDERSGTGCLHFYEYLNAKYNSHPNIIHYTVLADTCSWVIWCTCDFESLYQFAPKAAYIKPVRHLLSITISKLHIAHKPSKIFCAKPDAIKKMKTQT
jgi:hypothetical protein